MPRIPEQIRADHVVDAVAKALPLLAIYERVHDELDQGKAWGEIDNGLTAEASDWSYHRWCAYMRQSLINNLRSIALVYEHASALEARQGRDPQGLGAKPDIATAEGRDAHT